MPTVELQTNIVFISVFKIQFSVSDNTVISFQSKERMGLFFFFLLYLCVMFEIHSGSQEEGQTVQKDFKCTK